MKRNGKNYEFEGDFTIDYWLKLGENPNEWAPIVLVYNYPAIVTIMHNGKKFNVRDGGYTLIELDPLELNKWTHIAICRKDSFLYVFYDGKLQRKLENNQKFNSGNLCIGTDKVGNFLKNSYIDELRILKGYAKWTSDFDVPTKEYKY